ncbi:hypothetical protein EVAR_51726_1 [Eumeta japonica]|uniref:Uncharacterized protein n=1 Tax=Eumeta variegata TaxID=151549 RepID=A0A4C1XJV1_EUMVA|nr:hypothetical protein EVAR_51726_1 [Eumeta japonica]
MRCRDFVLKSDGARRPAGANAAAAGGPQLTTHSPRCRVTKVIHTAEAIRKNRARVRLAWRSTNRPQNQTLSVSLRTSAIRPVKPSRTSRAHHSRLQCKTNSTSTGASTTNYRMLDEGRASLIHQTRCYARLGVL